MEDVLHFVTFVINVAVILLQFILSVLSDKPSAGDYIRHDDVRELSFCECHEVCITEFLSGVIINLPISFDLVVAEWVWSKMCYCILLFIHDGEKVSLLVSNQISISENFFISILILLSSLIYSEK